MQMNDGGTTSFFAVLRKSSSDQKSRIQKSAEKKKAEKKAAEKKQEKERLEKSKESRTEDDTQTIILTANSVEELMDKIGEYTFVERSNEVRTDREKLMGQHVDYKLQNQKLK